MELNRNTERLMSFAGGAAFSSFSFLPVGVCWLDSCHFCGPKAKTLSHRQKESFFWGGVRFADGRVVLKA